MATAKHDWLNPINRITLHRAFIRKQTKIRLLDNRFFVADYTRKPGKVFLFETDSAGNPKFAPRGWFDLRKVTDPIWIETRNG